jgi:hypothetical protein
MGSYSKFVAFFNEPARVEINDKVVTVMLRSGRDFIEFAMPLCVYAQNVQRGKRALERYSAGDQSIIIDD